MFSAYPVVFMLIWFLSFSLLYLHLSMPVNGYAAKVAVSSLSIVGGFVLSHLLMVIPHMLALLLFLLRWVVSGGG